MSAVQRKYFLSQLLPYDCAKKRQGELRSGLKEYQFLLLALEGALQALQEGDLEQFDALVGENACQIRAVKIALSASELIASVSDMGRRLLNARERLEGFLKSIDKLMKSKVSLKHLLEMQEVDVSLTVNEQFCIEAYILCKAKRVECSSVFTTLFRVEETAPQNLRFGDVTSSFKVKLVRNLKPLLATASVAFVQERAELLGNRQLIDRCVRNLIVYHNEISPCLPMFFCYKILLQSAQRENIPLVLCAKFLRRDGERYQVVEQEVLFFRPSDLSQYEERVPTSADLVKSAVVIQGVVCPKEGSSLSRSAWRNTVRDRGVDVVLAGAADHRQYPPNPEQDRRLVGIRDEDYERCKILAQREGYALDNPTTFFIQHTYAAMVGSIVELRDMVRRRPSVPFTPRDIVHSLNAGLVCPQLSMNYTIPGRLAVPFTPRDIVHGC